jgi:hypothetical protein
VVLSAYNIERNTYWIKLDFLCVVLPAHTIERNTCWSHVREFCLVSFYNWSCQTG